MPQKEESLSEDTNEQRVGCITSTNDHPVDRTETTSPETFMEVMSPEKENAVVDETQKEIDEILVEDTNVDLTLNEIRTELEHRRELEDTLYNTIFNHINKIDEQKHVINQLCEKLENMTMEKEQLESELRTSNLLLDYYREEFSKLMKRHQKLKNDVLQLSGFSKSKHQGTDTSQLKSEY